MIHPYMGMFALVAALTLSGCGGDSNDSSQVTEPDADEKTETISPADFSKHGDVLENEVITIQAESGETFVNLSKDLTVSGTLHIKDPK